MLLPSLICLQSILQCNISYFSSSRTVARKVTMILFTCMSSVNVNININARTITKLETWRIKNVALHVVSLKNSSRFCVEEDGAQTSRVGRSTFLGLDASLNSISLSSIRRELTQFAQSWLSYVRQILALLHGVQDLTLGTCACRRGAAPRRPSSSRSFEPPKKV